MPPEAQAQILTGCNEVVALSCDFRRNSFWLAKNGVHGKKWRFTQIGLPGIRVYLPCTGVGRIRCFSRFSRSIGPIAYEFSASLLARPPAWVRKRPSRSRRTPLLECAEEKIRVPSAYLSRANRQLRAFFALSRINNLCIFNTALGSSPAGVCRPASRELSVSLPELRICYPLIAW
jgi:hypothetical protein